jgi:hypothetical protein
MVNSPRCAVAAPQQRGRRAVPAKILASRLVRYYGQRRRAEIDDYPGDPGQGRAAETRDWENAHARLLHW